MGSLTRTNSALLISLRILHKLLTECKRDIGLFARQTLRIISAALDVKVYQKGTPDLEVIARAASCFVAFATYTDGAAIGVDDALTTSYLAVLRQFAGLATVRSGSSQNGSVNGATALSEKTAPVDVEDQSRTRLIGLSALSGAACSDAVFSSSAEFPRQAKIIVPTLLSILREASVDDLKAVTASNTGDNANVAPFFKELSARRPVSDRRAPSIHEHVPGEKGPDQQDVVAAAYRCLYELVSECQLTQAGRVLDIVIEYLDSTGWSDTARCCWLAERLTGGMLLQSRFVMPTRLVELLVSLPDSSPPTAKQHSIISMVTTVLSSNVSLVGLAVTDLLTSLLNIIVRRATIRADDALLPALVDCVSSLGVHIYYADQINDIVEEIAAQIATISPAAPGRQDILRVLIYCLSGVMSAAEQGDSAEAALQGADRAGDTPTVVDKGKAPAIESPGVEVKVSGRRNPVSPEVWQDTLHLLCESTYPVRASYARALLLWLQDELPADRRPRPDEPNIMRFCNALHAAVYTLALSSRLGPGEPIPSLAATPREATPRQSGHATPSTPGSTRPTTPKDGEEREGTLTAKQAQQAAQQIMQIHSLSTSSFAAPKRTRRRVSLPLNRLASTEPAQFDTVATPGDYANLAAILGELGNNVPSAALLTGAPMLLALDSDAGTQLVRRPGETGAWAMERKRAARELVCRAWVDIGRAWSLPSVTQQAESGLQALGHSTIPVMRDDDEPAEFVREGSDGESASSTRAWLDPAPLVSSVCASADVQTGTGLTSSQLQTTLEKPWSVESAIKGSIERLAPPTLVPQGEHKLMSIPNPSYQSIHIQRGIDVADLRDALGSNPTGSLRRKSVNHGSVHSSRPSTIHGSGTPGGSTGHGTAERKLAPADAREVLKDIFKEKKRSRIVTPGTTAVNSNNPSQINGTNADVNGVGANGTVDGVNGGGEPFGGYITDGPAQPAQPSGGETFGGFLTDGPSLQSTQPAQTTQTAQPARAGNGNGGEAFGGYIADAPVALITDDPSAQQAQQAQSRA